MSNGPSGETGVAAVDAPLVVHVVDEQASASHLSLSRVANICRDRGVPIRMRINIQLWDYEQYVAWKGQVWKVEVRDQTEAELLQQAMEGFFDLVALKGVIEAGKHLADLLAPPEIVAAPEAGQEMRDAGHTTT